WSGALGLLLAYALLSGHRVTATSSGYRWLNVLGAAGLALNGAVHGALPSVALNLVWCGIGLVSWLATSRRGSDSPGGPQPSGGR
ncbi:MAG: CBU_0592 family membrane protein, partial [Angustibacter sp.]